MKGQFIFFISALLSFSASAQKDSIYVWNKWCARKDTLLLFYSGNNTIQLYSSGMQPGAYKIKSLDKSLRIGQPEIKGDTMSVLAMPYPAKNKMMRLAILDAKTSKLIKTVNFTADTFPDPVARIGNIINNESYKKTILAQTKIRAVFPNSLYSYPYSIRQYTLKTKTEKGPVSMPVNGFFLNTTILRAINETPDGSVLEFTNIKATCPECATRSLEDLKLKIKVVSFDSTTTIHVPAK
jgi:hypothetical protein